MKNRKLILILILIIAAALRFYKLGEIPPGLDWDEASNAYNAYSILKTARDEYGEYLPMYNRSFEDYKPPMYMYLEVPTVAVFGLTPLAARLPSAIFGFLTIPIVYFFVKRLFENYQWKEQIAIISTFLLAISPWHIQFSRVGFEANLGLFFTTAAFTAFLLGLAKHKWLILSGILMGVCAYSYHTQRIFVPIMFIAAVLIFKDEILKIKKKYIFFFILSVILTIAPLLIFTPTKILLQRFETTSSDQRLEDVEKSIGFILEDKDTNTGFLQYMHNRRIVIAQRWLGNYLSHFDFNFLFTNGDSNFRHHIQDMGMLYLFQLPLIIYGIYRLILNRSKSALFIFSWLIIAPFAAAPANPAPHAVRTLPMIIPLNLISAFAITSFPIKNAIGKIALFLPLTIWATISTVVYLHNYYVHYPIEKASFWQYGYKEAVVGAEEFKDQFTRINVDKKIEQGYIFWLFNLSYDPRLYQKSGTRDHFDKYYFESKQPEDPKEIFISEAKGFPQDFIILKTIFYPNGEEAIKIGHPTP